MNTWLSKRMSCFIGILSGVRDIFLPSCSQVFFSLNVKFSAISEPHKSPVKKKENLLINNINR